MYNVVNTIASILDRIFFIFADKEDNHKVSNEFEILPDRTVERELAALERLENSP